MELPQITIPQVIIDSIPMDQVPAIVHPPLVHFAIVLPIMIVLLELVNIIVKSGETPEEPKGRGVSTLSFLLILAMVVIFGAAFVSGSVDGKAAWDALGAEGQAELKEHKLIGTYLVYSSIVLLVFKLISFMGSKSRIFFLLLAIAFAAGTLKQGKDGGELVYEYGANVAKVKALDDKVFELEDELDSCESETEAKDATPAAKPLEDSVVKEEAAALANPEPVTGEAAAQAAVEETRSKDALEAKEAASSFLKEDAADVQKVTDAEAVKTVAAEEKVVAEEEAAPAAQPLEDSVAKEEAAAIAAPEAVKGEAAAQAQVEEGRSKDAFEAKEAASSFVKEDAADVKKEVTEGAVQAVESAPLD